MTSLGERVRLSVLEGRIDELTHFIVPSNLRRLEQHGVNLREYHDGKEWSKIETEQRNAVRTIQALKTHIRELEDVKSQVREEELKTLQTLIQPVQEDIINTITAFREIDMEIQVEETEEQDSDDDGTTPGSEYVLLTQTNCDVATWEALHQDLEDLNILARTLAGHVSAQHSVIDRVDERVQETSTRIDQTTYTVASLSRIKASMMPVSGALVGGVVGGVVAGPLGLMAGLKVGTITAVAGGAAGALGGGILGYMRGKTLTAATEFPSPETPKSAIDKKND